MLDWTSAKVQAEAVTTSPSSCSGKVLSEQAGPEGLSAIPAGFYAALPSPPRAPDLSISSLQETLPSRHPLVFLARGTSQAERARGTHPCPASSG
jgi:hypothetical protein